MRHPPPPLPHRLSTFQRKLLLQMAGTHLALPPERAPELTQPQGYTVPGKPSTSRPHCSKGVELLGAGKEAEEDRGKGKHLHPLPSVL